MPLPKSPTPASALRISLLRASLLLTTFRRPCWPGWCYSRKLIKWNSYELTASTVSYLCHRILISGTFRSFARGQLTF